MKTKTFLRYKNRIDYFDCDIELVDVYIRNNDILAGEGKKIFLGINSNDHPFLSRRTNNHDSRKIVLKHLRNTVYRSYMKNLYEESTNYFCDILSLFSRYNRDAKRIVGSDKVEINVLDILEDGNIASIISNIVDKIFTKQENQRNAKELIEQINKRMNLHIDSGLINNAFLFLEIRHLLVHSNGIADEYFVSNNPTMNQACRF
jgi:hypothetical protein